MRLPPLRPEIINRRTVLLCALLILIAGATFAQRSKKQKSKGPRALAVMEWTANGPRLIPVVIKVDDQFYDASIYQASPVPMALDPGTIYEATSAGKSLGLFTIDVAKQSEAGWFGEGRFQTREQLDKPKTKSAPAVKAKNDEDEGPPVLRKTKPKSESSQPTAAPAPTPAPAPPTAAAKPAATVNEPKQDDEARPVLRRGTSTSGEQASQIKEKELPHKKEVPAPVGVSKMQLAISDATPAELRPYTWEFGRADEEQRVQKLAQTLAAKALAALKTKRPDANPGNRFEDVQFKAMDVDLDNEPIVIYSARVPAGPSEPAAVPAKPRSGAKTPAKPAPSLDSVPATPVQPTDYYVTIVAREDYDGNLRTVFSSATDGQHLDLDPRYVFIDAADVDGNGRGDLVFREISGSDAHFVVYRVGADSLKQLARVIEPAL